MRKAPSALGSFPGGCVDGFPAGVRRDINGHDSYDYAGSKDAAPRRDQNMASTFVEIFGWLGSAAVVTAYALISTNRLQNTSIAYQLLNFAGSACLIANTVYYRAYPSAFVNCVWLLIALFALTRIGTLRKRTT